MIWEGNTSVTMQILWWESTHIAVWKCYPSSGAFPEDFPWKSRSLGRMRPRHPPRPAWNRSTSFSEGHYIGKQRYERTSQPFFFFFLPWCRNNKFLQRLWSANQMKSKHGTNGPNWPPPISQTGFTFFPCSPTVLDLLESLEHALVFHCFVYFYRPFPFGKPWSTHPTHPTGNSSKHHIYPAHPTPTPLQVSWVFGIKSGTSSFALSHKLTSSQCPWASDWALNHLA